MLQAQVGQISAPGVEGDFAASNPRATLLAGPGALTVDSGWPSVRVGTFCWLANNVRDADGAPATVTNVCPGGPTSYLVPDGFIARPDAQSTLDYATSESSLEILAGRTITVFTSGDFFVRNSGTTDAVIGQFAYANTGGTGLISFGPDNTPRNGWVQTKWRAVSAGGPQELIKISDDGQCL